MTNMFKKDEIEAKQKELDAQGKIVVNSADYQEEKKAKDLRSDAEKDGDEADAKMKQDMDDNGPKKLGRGTPWMPSTGMANLIFMYGCPPSNFVLADTRMLRDLFDSLRSRFDPNTLAIELPKMLDDLQSDVMDPDDAKWEILKSNQI